MSSIEEQVYEILGKTHVKADPDKVVDFFARYLTSGNVMGSAKGSGISNDSAKQWLRTKWSDEVMDLMRTNMQVSLQSRFTGLIDKALNNLEDRLDNGDTDARGEKSPVKAANIVTVISTLYDKRALLRGEPTSRTEKTTTEKRLEKLSKRFEALPKASPKAKPDEDSTESEIVH